MTTTIHITPSEASAAVTALDQYAHEVARIAQFNIDAGLDEQARRMDELARHYRESAAAIRKAMGL